MGETFDIVSYLVTVCPALGILAWVVVHFKGELKDKDALLALKDREYKETIAIKDKRIEDQAEEIKEIVRDNITVETRILDALKYLNDGKR